MSVYRRIYFSYTKVISTTSAPKLSQSSPTYAPSRNIDVVTLEIYFSYSASPFDRGFLEIC
jgi:hypothetical protein